MTEAAATPALRCAVAARQAGETGVGTAAPVRTWLLLERSGPWPRSAVEAVLAELPTPLRRRIAALTREEQLRVLLIRRARRHARTPDPPAVFAGSADPQRPWLERLAATGLEELGAYDLESIAAGRPGAGEPVSSPLFLVCAHGSRELCCAVEGRPMLGPLVAAYGDRVWECTHVGGDRFAGNLVVVPHGEYHGWLTPEDALEVAQHADRDEVRVANLRGRSAYDPWQQAAEVAVRRRFGLLARGALRCGPAVHGNDPGMSAVVSVDVPEGRVEVRIERRRTGTMAASRCRPALQLADYVVTAIEEAPARAKC